MPLSPSERARLKELVEKATPWKDEMREDRCTQCSNAGRIALYIEGIRQADHAMFADESQAELIAAANPKLLGALLADLEAAEQANRELQESRNKYAMLFGPLESEWNDVAWLRNQLVLANENVAAAERERDALREAREEVLVNPYGCQFCDSGKSRKINGSHDAQGRCTEPKCGFAMARAATPKEQTR